MSEKKKTLSLSIPKGYEKEVEFLKTQPNKSQYVWNLIRADMKRQDEDYQIVDMVRQMYQQVTTLSGGLPTVQAQPTTNVNNFSNDKKKKGAMSLLS